MISGEQLLPLGRAARELPELRGGRPVNPATLRRWACKGLRGVRLEVLRCGGTVCTSREALQRFFLALSGAAEPSAIGTPRQPSLKEVNERLDRMGVRQQA
jgi:hypothetical protein